MKVNIGDQGTLISLRDRSQKKKAGKRIIRKAKMQSSTKQTSPIRERLAQGEAIASIAKSYEVIYQLIYYIAKGKTWKHVE